MFFANAKYESKEYGIVTIALCSNEQTEQEWSEKASDDLFRVYYERPIAQEIMRAAAKDILPTSFSCNEINYRLLKYTCWPEERFYNQFRQNHVARKERLTRYCDIFVYSERCRCTACYAQWGFDSIENICGIVQTVHGSKRTVEIDVQHCRQCGNYFIETRPCLKNDTALYYFNKMAIAAIWTNARNEMSSLS